jgi:hypothetical protein
MSSTARLLSGPRTVYLVTAFNRTKGRLKAEQPRHARDEAHALDLVARLALTKAGVVATCQDVDEEAGDYGDAKILDSAGELPPDFTGAA